MHSIQTLLLVPNDFDLEQCKGDVKMQFLAVLFIN